MQNSLNAGMLNMVPIPWRHPVLSKTNIMHRNDFTSCMCKTITSLCNGGTLDVANLILICSDCAIQMVQEQFKLSEGDCSEDEEIE